jgi:hypothetical protein
MPRGHKVVVLGVVTSNSGALESKGELKRRIDEAAKYVRLASVVAAMRLRQHRRGQCANRGRAVGKAASLR